MRLFTAAYAPSLRRELRRISAAEAVPLVAHLQLTYKCNLSCSCCRSSQEEHSDSELTFAEIDALLAQLSHMGALYLLLSGGEIMTRQDFWDIARRAKERGFLLVLCTNGSLIGPEEADRIKKLSPVSVEINLLGTSAASHDDATGVAGSFRRAIRAAEELSKRGVNVTVRTSPRVGDPMEGNELSHFVQRTQHDSGQRTLEPRVTGDPISVDRSLRRGGSLIQEEEAMSFQQSASEGGQYGERQLRCIAGKALATITPRGDVRACDLLPVQLGNVRDRTFREIWCSAQQVLTPESSAVEPYSDACLSGWMCSLPCSTRPCGILGG